MKKISIKKFATICGVTTTTIRNWEKSGKIISERTSQNYDRVHKDGDRDYWMSAQDAKKYGMIDEIILNRK
jgi:ATP-dependent protease ClpP protease subunit